MERFTASRSTSDIVSSNLAGSPPPSNNDLFKAVMRQLDLRTAVFSQSYP
jgi:hypothetical protein